MLDAKDCMTAPIYTNVTTDKRRGTSTFTSLKFL